MNISCIGSGYVGLVVGTCLADLGNDIICHDTDKDKVAALKNGVIPIYEPGLKDMFDRNIKEERLNFSTDIKECILKSEVIFITVGTPPGKDHEADLSAVKIVAKNIGENINGYKVIVNKSTVPVGTATIVDEIISKESKDKFEFDVVSNPEFLREGEALKDFTNPDRIVIGVNSDRAKKLMGSIYRGIARTDKPIMFTDIRSAELIKYASNAMLATRISFMNEIALLCEKVGADVKEVAKGMGMDTRIGPRFLQTGLGYGGSCFPKDVKALSYTIQKHNLKCRVLDAVSEVNDNQKKIAIPKLQELLPDLKDKNIAIWGLAFKPKTDDMREAPSVEIINGLQKLGANIRAFDPEAEKMARKILKNVEYCKDPYETVKDCDALIIVTEWNEFRALNIKKIKKLLKHPNIVDGRNIYSPEEMRDHGFNYIGVGR